MASLVAGRDAQAHEPVAGDGDKGLEDGGVGVVVIIIITLLAGEGEVGGRAGRSPGDVEGVEGIVGELWVIVLVLGGGDDGVEPCYVGIWGWVYGEDRGEKGGED